MPKKLIIFIQEISIGEFGLSKWYVGRGTYIKMYIRQELNADTSAYRATVTVNHFPDRNITLHNVIATIPGKLFVSSNFFLKQIQIHNNFLNIEPL